MPKNTFITTRRVALLGIAAALTAGIAGCGGPSSVGPTPTPTATAASETVEWSYEGETGPDVWGSTANQCAASDTARQSPIDIATAAIVPASGADLEMHYTPTTYTIENTGHSIEAVPEDTKGSFITLGGTEYFLKQFHFHASSEHAFDGASTAAEIHLVHTAADGAIAVVGVLVEPGEANAALDDLFRSVPQLSAPGAEVELATQIDPAALIPADGRLAQYDGSLTTPPCTEGVAWNVFLTPQTVSAEQLAALTGVYPDNHRPVQSLNDRTVSGGSVK